jgi:ketosteroid isomerase-like protein
MNRRPLSLAWTLAAFLGACAPPSPSPLTDEEEARIEAEVLARAETFLDAHRTLDLDRVMEHFTDRDDLTYAEAAFIYADREEVREGYFGAFTRGMTSFEGEWIDARVIPLGRDAAAFMGIYRYLSKDIEGNARPLRDRSFSAVLRREGGVWKIVQSHESDARVVEEGS